MRNVEGTARELGSTGKIQTLLETRVSSVRPSRPPSASCTRRFSSARPRACAASGLDCAMLSCACAHAAPHHQHKNTLPLPALDCS